MQRGLDAAAPAAVSRLERIGGRRGAWRAQVADAAEAGGAAVKGGVEAVHVPGICGWRVVVGKRPTIHHRANSHLMLVLVLVLVCRCGWGDCHWPLLLLSFGVLNSVDVAITVTIALPAVGTAGVQPLRPLTRPALPSVVLMVASRIVVVIVVVVVVVVVQCVAPLLPA